MTDNALEAPSFVRIKLEAVDETVFVMLLDVKLDADKKIDGHWGAYGKISDYDEQETLQDYPIILSKDGEIEFSPAEGTIY